MYYKNGQPYHAGVVKVDGAIYYIGSGGKAVKGRHIVHGDMANNILKRGTYTFGDDYKLVKGSYKAPKKHHRRKSLSQLLGIPKKSKRRSGKKFNFDKKHMLYTGCALALALVLLLTAVLVENTTPHSPTSSNGTDSTTSAPVIILPEFTEDVLLCSTAAKAEYDGEITLKQAVQTGDPYRALQFEYQLAGASGNLILSRDPSFADAREYFMPSSDTVITIDNLLTGTTYYYKVIVDGKEYPGSFRTAESTRFVSIPGLFNTRDIGGKTTLDGKTVRQGLLIRGLELDGLVEPTYFLPTENIEEVTDTFGFAYDMDLREATLYPGTYTSRLGIPHKFYTSPQYGGIFSVTFRDSLHQIISDLAKPENYPMYLHCTYGTDRTGTIVFLLQGILNMSEEDMVREYRLTAYFNKPLAESNNMEPVIQALAPYEGDTLQEKIVTYLTTVIGITESEIESIRSIFLEG